MARKDAETISAKTLSEEQLSAQRPAAPAAFTKQFLARLLPDDLAAMPRGLQQRLTASIWQLAQERLRGSVSLRVFNPSLEKDGWEVDHTVIEIISDDMPFLVASVSGELQRRGLAVHMSIHPVLFVQRDTKGRLQNLLEDSAEAHAHSAESFMHFQIDHGVDPNMHEHLASSLRSILDDVRAAVEDWPKLRHRMTEITAEIYAPGGAAITPDEVDETRHFLTWLDHNNFTYLGYRMLDLSQRGERMQWRIVPGSGLGILRNDDAHMFGGLRDLTTQPTEVRRFLQEQRLITIVKTNQRSRVHRTVPMEAIFVQRFDTKGAVIGEHLFVGLFTSVSYTQSARMVPLLRQKIAHVIAQANFDPTGHNGRALTHIVDSYPREELFQIDSDALYHNCVAIVQLQERARAALFLRRDPFNRFYTCIIYVPRDRYDTRVRKSIHRLLEEAFSGHVTDQNIRIDDSPLARMFLTVSIMPDSTQPDHAKLEAQLREICRSWTDRLRDGLVAQHGEVQALNLLRRYGAAFPSAYRERTNADIALRDIHAIERAQAGDRLIVKLSSPDEAGLLHFKLFQPGYPLVLSNVLPLIENMGLKVEYMDGPHEVAPQDRDRKVYIHEFVCRPGEPDIVDFAKIKPLFEDAFEKVWMNEAEDDGFNALTLRAGMPWREVMVLRALARYLRQLRIPYSHELMITTLLAHPHTARNLAALFLVRHDPDLHGDREQKAAVLTDAINEALGGIKALEEDRIIRRYLNLIQSMLRTNYFQRTADGAPKPYLSIKFDSRAVDYMPLPKPLVEIFVYSPRVEAVHLRGGKVARGGIRWSDRREDFRNEILGLVKAQMVKNSVIVPVGSKGGFIVKQPPQESDKFQAEGIACYRTMMCGLLDLTDNRVGNKIVPPDNVVRHDGDDPYLVVAADKGTARFSDIANGIAQEYGFWLDDAFASGGSVGYDHKQMGITARGAWEAVKRHFRELGKDIQTTDFTCVGVGDMSGDVFGNGMLLSKHTRMIGAFDHRHIFCDPSPDAATSFAERKRLFNLPRSSWDDYDRKKMSKGGGVFARSDKVIKLSSEIKRAYGITVDSLTPSELIQAMLRCKVDLLYFGGIGTYVKSAEESHEEVGDRTNDALRIDGGEIQASVVGEGANLAMTQRGRIEYALKRGGRINTDAIDNCCGVATSDHEVNIKILLRKMVTGGSLPLNARNKILASMTDDVAALVLEDNYRQTEALTMAEAQATTLLPLHTHTIRVLEKAGLLNRAVEFLPNDADIAERQRLGKGLTRPELAVLLSYAKIWLYEQILASNLPDDAFLQDDLLHYFPEALQKKYAHEIAQHQLRREIIATGLTNDLVNRAGCHFMFAMMDRTGKTAIDIARAYLIVRASYDMPTLWDAIDKLDNKVSAATQTMMLLAVNRTMNHVVPWFLSQAEMPLKLSNAIAQYRDGVERMTKWLGKNPSTLDTPSHRTMSELDERGVPETLSGRLAIMPYLAAAPDMTLLAEQSACGIEQASSAFFGLGRRLGLDWLRERAESVTGIETPWQREAVALLLDDVFESQRALASNMMGIKVSGDTKKGCHCDPLPAWTEKHAERLEHYDALLNELRATGTLDLAMLTLASRHLSALVKRSCLVL